MFPIPNIRLYSGIEPFPTRQPRRWGGYFPSGRGTPTLLPDRPFLWCGGQYPRERCDPYPIQTGRSGHPQFHSVFLGELDCFLCCHGTPGCQYLRLNIFPYRESLPDSERGEWQYQAPQCVECVSGARGGHDKSPCSGILQVVLCHQYRRLYALSPDHSQWYGYGG